MRIKLQMMPGCQCFLTPGYLLGIGIYFDIENIARWE